MSSGNPHDMLSCPYNVSHQIERYKMQFHLEKCRKQHPNTKKVHCPFDATHIINDVELDHHVSICNKRAMFDREAFVIEDTTEYRPLAQPVQPVAPSAQSLPLENWDEDNYSSYVPAAANANNPHIIKKIKGATPSERRQARMEGVKNYVPPN